MTEIFLYLVNMSITASWLIIAVVVFRFLLKRAPKWINCLLWCLVGVRLLFPVSVESMFSLIPSANVVPQEILYAVSPAIDSGIEQVNQIVNPMLQNSFSPNPGDSVNPLQVVTFVASYVWIIGVVILLFYTLITYFRLKIQVGDAVRFQENIFRSEKVDSPFVLGVVRPRIYIPYGLEDEEVQCVIAHEQAHIKRKDYLWKPLAFLILAVYWFNPLVWVAYTLLCRDIEYACDEKVMAQLGEDKKKIYSVALLHCSVGAGNYRRMIAACPIAFGEVGVKNRIKGVLNYKKPAFWMIVLALLVCIVCAVCFMTNPKEEENESDLPGLESAETDSVIQEFYEDEFAESSEQTNQKDSGEYELEEQGIMTSPPTLILQDALSSTLNYFAVESGTYSWNYRSTENNDTAIGVQASGPTPQMAVKGQEWLRVVDYNRIDYAPYTVRFDVVPDRIVVREYDSLDLGDLEAEVLTEAVYEEVFAIDLRARRIYEVVAEWDEEHLDANGFYGVAYYAFATDNTMLDLEDAVTIEAQVKELMADKEECIVITSKTDSFPGAFELRVPMEVYNENELRGGDGILVTMRDTKVESDTGLPIYKALYLERQENTNKNSDIAIGDRFTGEVNTLNGVTMQMEKYKATEGEVLITNNTDKELQYGEYYDIQVQADGAWYSIQPLGEFAYHMLAYPVGAGETRAWPVNWELVYGALPEGNYRIVKDIMDYRAPGDYTEYYLAAEFEIKHPY